MDVRHAWHPFLFEYVNRSHRLIQTVKHKGKMTVGDTS